VKNGQEAFEREWRCCKQSAGYFAIAGGGGVGKGRACCACKGGGGAAFACERGGGVASTFSLCAGEAGEVEGVGTRRVVGGEVGGAEEVFGVVGEVVGGYSFK